VRRELQEEIGWQATDLTPWFSRTGDVRMAHFFRGSLTVPLERLQLAEGQDMKLAELSELRRGSAWSPRLGERRPLALALQLALERLTDDDAAEESGQR
jgi:8-oxo-dGTP diphosphatase